MLLPGSAAAVDGRWSLAFSFLQFSLGKICDTASVRAVGGGGTRPKFLAHGLGEPHD